MIRKQNATVHADSLLSFFLLDNAIRDGLEWNYSPDLTGVQRYNNIHWLKYKNFAMYKLLDMQFDKISFRSRSFHPYMIVKGQIWPLPEQGFHF